jgi:hypothetical protein
LVGDELVSLTERLCDQAEPGADFARDHDHSPAALRRTCRAMHRCKGYTTAVTAVCHDPQSSAGGQSAAQLNIYYETHKPSGQLPACYQYARLPPPTDPQNEMGVTTPGHGGKPNGAVFPRCGKWAMASPPPGVPLKARRQTPA